MTSVLEKYIVGFSRTLQFRAGGSAFALVMLLACTQNLDSEGPPVISFAELSSALGGRLAECHETYGIASGGPPEAGENELPEGEREWLECAYKGIEEIMIPNTKFPNMYHRLILDIRTMTDLVERGEITRTQRKNAINVTIGEIENAEIVSLIRSSETATVQVDREKTANLHRTFASIRTMAIPQSPVRR